MPSIQVLVRHSPNRVLVNDQVFDDKEAGRLGANRVLTRLAVRRQRNHRDLNILV